MIAPPAGREKRYSLEQTAAVFTRWSTKQHNVPNRIYMTARARRNSRADLRCDGTRRARSDRLAHAADAPGQYAHDIGREVRHLVDHEAEGARVDQRQFALFARAGGR